MAKSIRELMTKNPASVSPETPVSVAAKKMREKDTGALIVEDGGKLCGIVTDRDVTIRVVAEDADPKSTPVSKACSEELFTLSPDASAEEAVRIMRQKAIRRVPVVENGRPIGIVSLGDLAMALDPKSALADISAAPPNA